MADTLTPEEKKRLTEELTKYANEGASDDDLRKFRDAFISEIKKKGGTTQGSGQPVQQPGKPSAPSFGQKIVTEATTQEVQIPLKGKQKAPVQKKPYQDIYYKPEALPSETTQTVETPVIKAAKQDFKQTQVKPPVKPPVTEQGIKELEEKIKKPDETFLKFQDYQTSIDDLDELEDLYDEDINTFQAKLSRRPDLYAKYSGRTEQETIDFFNALNDPNPLRQNEAKVQWDVEKDAVYDNFVNDYKSLKSKHGKTVADLDVMTDKLASDIVNEKTYKDFLAKREFTGAFAGEDVQFGEVINMSEVDRVATEIVDGYGLPTDSDAWRLMKNKIKATVFSEYMKPKVQEELKRSNPELLAKRQQIFEAGFEADDDIYAKTDSVLTVLQAQYEEDAKRDMDLINSEYVNASKKLNEEYEQYNAGIEQQQLALNDMRKNNQIDQLEYEAAFTKLEEDKKAFHNQYQAKYPSYDEYVKKSNEINSRYNRKFEIQKKIITDKAQAELEAAYKKYAETYQEDPELLKQLNEAYKTAYDTVAKQRGEKMKLGATMSANPFSSLYNSTLSAMGGVFKGWGGSLDSKSLELLGETMEQNFEMPAPRTEDFSDWTDPQNALMITGNVAGSMGPTMIPTAAAAIGTTYFTGGLGAPAAASMVTAGLAGALAGWGAETIDMAGRSYLDVFERSGGDVARANQAAKRTVKSQYDIMWAYSFEALPFIGKALKFIPTQAARVGVGGLVELGTEFTQEIRQNIAEENIVEFERDPWYNFDESINDERRRKQTLISIGPVALMGGAGQIGSKSIYQDRRDAAIAQQQKSALVNALPDQKRQYIQNMVFNRNGKFATNVIASLYAAGKIDEKQSADLMLEIQRAEQIKKAGKSAGLSGSKLNIYGFYSARAEEAERNAGRFANDPILKKSYEDMAKKYRDAGVEFMNGKNPDLLTLTYADGSQAIMMPEDVNALFADPIALSLLNQKAISIEAYDEKGQGPKIIEELKGRAEAYAKTNRYSEAAKIESPMQTLRQTIDERISQLEAEKPNLEEKEKQKEIDKIERELSESFAKVGEVFKENQQKNRSQETQDRDIEIERLQDQRKALGIDDVLAFFSDMKPLVLTMVERMEAGKPAPKSGVKAASDYLYTKYKELTAMKSDPNRMMTIAQIESIQAQIEQDLQTLEGNPPSQKTETNDQENIQGVSGQVGVGQEPVTAQPIEGTGAETTEAGGVLQASEEEVAPVSDIEAKKADIERTRKEDLELFEKAIYDGDRWEFPGPTKEKINAKYDAELAALEAKPTTEAAPEVKAEEKPTVPATKETKPTKPTRKERISKLFEEEEQVTPEAEETTVSVEEEKPTKKTGKGVAQKAPTEGKKPSKKAPEIAPAPRRAGSVEATEGDNPIVGAENTLAAAGMNETSLSEWKKANQKDSKKGRIEELAELVRNLMSGKIKFKEYYERAKQIMPSRLMDKVPALTSFKEIVGSIDRNKLEKGIINLNKFIKKGTRVGLRIDIPAFDRYGKNVVTVHEGKGSRSPIGYGSTGSIQNVTFRTSVSTAAKIGSGKSKEAFAMAEGEWLDESPESIQARAEEALNSPEWIQVGMNPTRSSFFFDKADGNPVVAADEVLQVGNLVLAKNAKKIDLNTEEGMAEFEKMFSAKTKEGVTYQYRRTGQGFRQRLSAMFDTEGERAAEDLARFYEGTGIDIEIIDDVEAQRLGQERNIEGKIEGIFLADKDSGVIYLNRDALKRVGKVLAYHEGIHPVINIIRNTNPELYKKVLDGIRAEAKRNPAIARAIRQIESVKEYQNRGPEAIEDETIVEVLARIAAGDIDLNKVDKTVKDNLIRFWNWIAKALRLPTVNPNASTQEFRDFAKKLSTALTQGGKLADVVGAENIKRFENVISDGQASIDSRIADKGVSVPRSEKLPLKIVASKEAEVMRKINELLDKYPNALTDKEQWRELMSRVFPITVDGEIFIPAFPEGLARMAGSVQETLKEIKKVSDEQRKLASEGLKGTKEIGELYRQGKMDEVDTGLYFLWNIMSIGISPYPQESGFLQAVNGGIDKYIKLAADGEFTKATLEEYLNWVDKVLPKGTPGAGSKSNLNSFGKSFLSKAAEEIESGEFKGKTKLQALHEILSDRKTPTNELRRKWQANMSSMQFNNKIFDFILLTTGRSDLFVTDRVRVDHFWDGNNFKKKRGLKESTSLYDGSDLTYGASTGAGFSKMLSDVPGLVFNELANRTMTPVVEKAYKQIGVKEYPEVGRFHWETWVAASSQEVSHGSIDAIVQRKEKGEIQDAGIRQGKYGAWDFNFSYKKRAGKDFVYEFVDNDGNTYVFDKISDIQDEIEKQKKKTYETNNRFLLPDAKGNISRPTKGLSNAWYDTEFVDSEKYFEFLRSKAKEVIPAPDVVEDQGVVIETPKPEKTIKKGQPSVSIDRSKSDEVASAIKEYDRNQKGYYVGKESSLFSKIEQLDNEIKDKEFYGYHSSKANIKDQYSKGPIDSQYENAISEAYSNFISEGEKYQNEDYEGMAAELEENGYGFTFVSRKDPLMIGDKYKYGNNLYKIYGDENVFKVDDPNEIDADIIVSKKPLYFKRVKNADEIADEYIKSKETKSNPQLVKIVDDFLDSQSQQKTTEQPLKKLTGDDVKTGTPVTIRFLKNPEKAPNLGKEFGQDVEPSGNYITQQETDFVPQGWNTGVVSFKKPLVIDVTDDTLVQWKRDLSERYGGLTGKKLTDRLKLFGYDGIITRNENDLGEIIAFDNAEQSKSSIKPGQPSVSIDRSSIEETAKALENETPILSTPKTLSTDGLPDLEIVPSTEANEALEAEIGGDKGIIDKNIRSIPIQEYDVPSSRRSKQVAEQIEENGWIEPLIVSYDKNGDVYIVEGQHRAAALKELGYDKAPVIVIYDKLFGKPKQGQFSANIPRASSEIRQSMEDSGDAVEQAIASGTDPQTAVDDLIGSQDWYNELTPRQKEQFDEILQDEFGVTPKAPKAKPTGVKAKIQNIVDNYYKLREGSKDEKRAAKAAINEILDADPKLKYIYNNISNINKELQAAGLITDKTDGCP